MSHENTRTARHCEKSLNRRCRQSPPIASKNPEPWLCIAEDDARLPKEVIQEIEDTITTTTDHDIVWFDSRGLGGTSLVCYHKSVLPQVVKHMHPLSDFSISPERMKNASSGPTCGIGSWGLTQRTITDSRSTGTRGVRPRGNADDGTGVRFKRGWQRAHHMDSRLLSPCRRAHIVCIIGTRSE